MQSYLQYREFGRKIQRQIERDKARAETLKRIQVEGGNHNDAATIPTESVSIENQSEKDTEKDLENASPPLEPSPTASSVSTAADPHSPGAEASVTDPETLAAVPTHHTIGTQLGVSLTGINVRSRATQEGKELGKVFVVGYEGPNDDLNPHNWSFRRKMAATTNIATIALIVGMASSIDSQAIPQASKELGVSQVTESLATGIFLIGFGCGGPFAGPLSETFGRSPVYIVTLILFMIFIMASGLSPNIGAQLAFRFIAGFFGYTPLTAAGGSISDLWTPLERVITFPIFANFGFLGPVLGPVLGGFIAQSTLISWRWTEWITLIISGLVLTSLLLLQPETYAPILLKWKASHLRRLTGDDRYRAPLEIRQEPLSSRLARAFWRPVVLLVHEPIIILFTLYLSVVYILLFGFFSGYAFVFTKTYTLSQGITGLLFLGIAIGLCIAATLVPFIYCKAKRELAARGKLQPEFRLWFAMHGAPFLPLSLFWMAWTAYPNVSLASPLIASIFFGYSILCIFISTYQYLIDSYEIYAASALSMITLVRYVVAGGMIPVTIPMYENLGVHWTLTVFACIALVFTPAPYLFYKFGPRIRKMSKYAFTREEE